MKLLLVFLMLVGLSTTGWSSTWDAQTTRTNTAITDEDIRKALSGISIAFTEAYPSQNFGIHVLVDRHVSDRFNGEAVYLSLGLCRKLPDGRYLLTLGSLSDLIFLPPGTSTEIQRHEVSQKLERMASDFSRSMVENRSRFTKGSEPTKR